MKTFTITAQETREYEVKVKAKNKEDAKDKFWGGEVDYGDNELVFSEVDNVYVK